MEVKAVYLIAQVPPQINTCLFSLKIIVKPSKLLGCKFENGAPNTFYCRYNSVSQSFCHFSKSSLDWLEPPVFFNLVYCLTHNLDFTVLLRKVHHMFSLQVPVVVSLPQRILNTTFRVQTGSNQFIDIFPHLAFYTTYTGNAVFQRFSPSSAGTVWLVSSVRDKRKYGIGTGDWTQNNNCLFGLT